MPLENCKLEHWDTTMCLLDGLKFKTLIIPKTGEDMVQ